MPMPMALLTVGDMSPNPDMPRLQFTTMPWAFGAYPTYSAPDGNGLPASMAGTPIVPAIRDESFGTGKSPFAGR